MISNNDVSLKSELKGSIERDISSISKVSLNDTNKIDNKEHETSIKYSTPIPKMKSAPLLRTRDSWSRVRKMFHSFELFRKSRNSHNLSENNASSIARLSLSSDRTIPIRLSPEEYADKTMSDYNLKELMQTPSEIIIIDPDVFEEVCSVMEKMLKAISRKMYFYKIGKFEPIRNEDDSMEYFFSNNDHLYDINKFLNRDNMEFFEIPYSETITEVSESKENEYFSYLKLCADNENSNSNNNSFPNSKNIVDRTISSEENTLMDPEELNNLNIYIKDELKYINFVAQTQKLKQIETINESLNKSDEIELRYKHQILHDDYFLLEYTEKEESQVKPENQDNKKNHVKINLEASKQILIQNNKNLSIKKFQENNSAKTKAKIEKENILKKREERLKLMRKAFASTTNGRKSITEKYKYSKSNIIIKFVPLDYKSKNFATDSSRLPKIKPATSLLPNTTKTNKNSFTEKRESRAKTAPPVYGPIDERQKYPRPITAKQPWGTITHPPYGLGYQRLTHYEIQQSVNRLYNVPKKTQQQKRAISCLPKSDYYEMV